ncbi:hypothetical protein GUITHDRAFT_152405 [Guillardia theta CCMP2712]|uniref:Uncharacterized protein n=1 Tax=Guillardia theta (strain CCMP2712) TaxID=905079 RepID=L1JDG9_GUITC|nr:hypothetical protein GUITHDRAFT_152405 [Guillardia theta CCMP2712]EKX46566.1 hypothetical protein GUITHDRAFT_152405 [Guillardia theta CCMP2712]|eukprot:XP_005833546.1 hypothetical protein GUITHDRAFT_152405 [Guillardia theta CCMP2712]
MLTNHGAFPIIVIYVQEERRVSTSSFHQRLSKVGRPQQSERGERHFASQKVSVLRGIRTTILPLGTRFQALAPLRILCGARNPRSPADEQVRQVGIRVEGAVAACSRKREEVVEAKVSLTHAVMRDETAACPHSDEEHGYE